MTPYAFLKDKSLLLLLHFCCMNILSIFLSLTGCSGTNIFLIIVCWLIIIAVWLIRTFLLRKRYFDEIDRILQNIDQRYLLGELLPDSYLLEDKLYQSMIHCSNKAMIEQLRRLEDEQRSYREYIESWIHEIKAPITAISLLSENAKTSENTVKMKNALRTVCLENQNIENYVEMVLYYARSENVYKDFLIQKTDLEEIAIEILEKNRYLLIQNQIRASADCPDIVYTDRKWISFIMNQIILNSVKYCCTSPFIHISTKAEKNGVILTISDNGIGIPAEELSRIFKKGFTGSNGRTHKS